MAGRDIILTLAAGIEQPAKALGFEPSLSYLPAGAHSPKLKACSRARYIRMLESPGWCPSTKSSRQGCCSAREDQYPRPRRDSQGYLNWRTFGANRCFTGPKATAKATASCIRTEISYPYCLRMQTLSTVATQATTLSSWQRCFCSNKKPGGTAIGEAFHHILPVSTVSMAVPCVFGALALFESLA